MSTVNDFHPRAMDLADLAFRHRRKGEDETAQRLFLEALSLEQQAAELLPPTKESEPSRSILYRSAASLAFNSGDYEAADKLIAHALIGYPPPEIKEELKSLYDDVNFRRHLSAKGIELSNEQWLMTLAGNATSHGGTQVDDLMLRVEKLATVFYRTVERLLKYPYRTNAGVGKEIKDNYGLYINAFMPSSFAVSFQLGRPNHQLTLLPGYEPKKPIEPEAVIDEVFKCFEILEGNEPDSLRERFDDVAYYDNFVGLAKQMAPDGEAIKLVGLTTIRDGVERPIALRKSRQQLRETKGLTSTPVGDVEVVRKTYKGVLKFANSGNRKFGTVKLDDIESGEKRRISIKVPIGLMKDVVQPFYEERVVVVVYETGDKKVLEEVALAGNS